MSQQIWRIPEGHSCIIEGLFVISLQPPHPQTVNMKIDGFFDIVSNMDYLLDVPREQALPARITYHDSSSQTFLEGAFVQVRGKAFTEYDDAGKSHLTLAATRLSPQPGDSSTSEYVRRSAPMSNPRDHLYRDRNGYSRGQTRVSGLHPLLACAP